ncbi:MAG: helix-turn-helix domain-containing protein [Dorea sp.]|nr:helix-turn-helix domain-containing protein [Oliverpabstia sp.]
MKNWMTCREAARLWNVTERWVSGLCSSGKLVGAIKQGRKWMIPADTAKPDDA